jgi:hypothetical protein
MGLPPMEFNLLLTGKSLGVVENNNAATNSGETTVSLGNAQ